MEKQPPKKRAASADGHVHLSVAAEPEEKRSSGLARTLVVVLAVSAVALFAWSFFLPWWKFQLYAPQYPGGLKLVISLTGVTGDVREIDILNHYIGMSSLEKAAPTERALAGYGVAGICFLVVALSLGAGKKLSRIVAVPAVAFPMIFIADSFYWLYRFGHDLNPKAPLKIGTFTPELFGNGQIGQFGTFAQPGLGFWVAVAAAAMVVAASLVRVKVCATCHRAGTCGAVCPRLMVLPDKPEPGSAT